jgi:hypothetical protein
MRGLKQHRCAQVISAGHAFIQNIRRGHYELATRGSRKPTSPGRLRRTGSGDLNQPKLRSTLPHLHTTQQPRLTWQRNTATSWRSTRISAFFVGLRASSPSHAMTCRKIRYSSVPPRPTIMHDRTVQRCGRSSPWMSSSAPTRQDYAARKIVSTTDDGVNGAQPTITTFSFRI